LKKAALPLGCATDSVLIASSYHRRSKENFSTKRTEKQVLLIKKRQKHKNIEESLRFAHFFAFPAHLFSDLSGFFHFKKPPKNSHSKHDSENPEHQIPKRDAGAEGNGFCARSRTCFFVVMRKGKGNARLQNNIVEFSLGTHQKLIHFCSPFSFFLVFPKKKKIHFLSFPISTFPILCE
jgi:hypothetical protein